MKMNYTLTLSFRDGPSLSFSGTFSNWQFARAWQLKKQKENPGFILAELGARPTAPVELFPEYVRPFPPLPEQTPYYEGRTHMESHYHTPEGG